MGGEGIMMRWVGLGKSGWLNELWPRRALVDMEFWMCSRRGDGQYAV